MHPKAKESIEKKLVQAFNSSTIVEGYIDFYSTIPEVDNFLNEALKHIQYVTHLDIIFAIQKFANFDIEKKLTDFEERRSYTDALQNLFSEEELYGLVKECINYLSNFPNEYEIYFPLRSIKTIYHQILDITDEVFLYEVKNKDDRLGQSYKSPFKFLRIRDEGDVYLCIKVVGNCIFTFENKFFQNSYSIFKQFIHSGLRKNLFQKNHNAPHYKSPIIAFQQQADKVLIKDLNYEKLDFVNLGLAPNVIDFISSLQLNTETFDLFKDSGVDSTETIEFMAKFIGSEILDPEDKKHNNLLTSIEWSFESSVNPNSTFSFIQLCIAMEAILSDASDSESITKTLADRAAYFIGESVKEREEIIVKFKELYSLRSKLVHGRKKNLNGKEREVYYWGMELLEKIIEKEFSLFK